MREDIKEIFLNVLEVDDIAEDDSAMTIAAWDSVRHLSLITAIEDRLGIVFDTDEIPALVTVRAILDAIRRRFAAAA